MELEKYIGHVIDNRYKIVKVIGKGGMAFVFEALDLAMKRVVALKVLKDDIAKDPQSVKRFINESKAISMLSHPNIVSIYDISIKGDLKYIVMERVEGITLKNYITKKGALSEREALIYTQQILKALEHAHSKGIIHRDIKPQNIMLLKNGVIKVTDFGIAKLPNAETVTVADKAIGTVYYISPEQASGKQIDPRSDLYSLGIVMYEMLTGDLPFKADTPVSVALKQINEQPKNPREAVPKLAVGVEQIILTAMEKNPDKRFQSATIMRRHVEQMLANPAYVFSDRKMAAVAAPTGVKALFAKFKSDKPKPKRESQSMLPIVLGISVSFVLILLIVGLMFVYEMIFVDNSEYKQITVPNFVGEIYSIEFKHQLEEQGYKVNVEYKDYKGSDEVSPGEILEQDPPSGAKRKITVGKQSCKLTLYICRDMTSNTVELSDYKMREYRNVVIKLENLGLRTRIKFQNHETIPDGMIIDMSPAAGTVVSKGDEIILTVSDGPHVETIEMPNLVGMDKDKAIKKLESLKLNAIVVEKESTKEEKGKVIEQGWEAGRDITTGNDITIIVGLGTDKEEEPEKPEPVTLGDYTGQDIDNVRAMLNALNIRHETISEHNNDYDDGKVFMTDPAPGTKVFPSTKEFEGTTIKIYVSLGRKEENSTNEDTTTAPDDTTKAPDDTTKAPDDTTKAPDSETTAPDNVTTAPEDTTGTPEETTGTPEQNGPDETP